MPEVAATVIVDLFAGPGGWDEGLVRLDVDDVVVGIEWDAAACATRVAAGHRTIRADVAAYPTSPFRGNVDGLIASPPCQGWSSSGEKKGRGDRPLIEKALDALAVDRDARSELAGRCEDPRSMLVVEPLRWARDLRPTWIALEQVPDVLDLWQAMALSLSAWGYSTVVAELDAADYGAPQHRRRAILLAHTDRDVHAPAPTHAEYPHPRLFGDELAPWRTMAEELGLAGGPWRLDRRNTGAPVVDPTKIPSPTVTTTAFGKGVWVLDGPDGRRSVSEAEAGRLQTVRDDYPWSGRNRLERHRQIGNAIPPLLAAHVLAALLGLDPPKAGS